MAWTAVLAQQQDVADGLHVSSPKSYAARCSHPPACSRLDHAPATEISRTPLRGVLEGLQPVTRVSGLDMMTRRKRKAYQQQGPSPGWPNANSSLKDVHCGRRPQRHGTGGTARSSGIA